VIPYSAISKKKVLGEGGAPRRAYGILGDAFLQNRVASTLLNWSLDADARDFNLDTLDGEGASVSDVFSLCGNLPFLSERRVVVVHRAERLENMHRAGEGEDAAPQNAKSKSKAGSPAKRLADGIKTLPPTTVLILQRSPETPDPGARASTPRCINANVDKALEGDGGGLIIDCTVSPKDARTPIAVVQNEAEARGIALEENVAQFLVERCGHDIALLLSELEKCALRAGEGNFVTRAVVEEMTRRKAQETIFDLTDALGDKKSAHALGLLRELLETGEAAPQILAMLVRHLRQLLQARSFLDAGLPLDGSTLRRLPPALAAQLPKDNLAAFLQNQNWAGKRFTSQARNFSVPQLQEALQAALEADLAMKGIEGDGGADSKKEPELLLELFVAKLV
jgi:DNA polymerase-3 subunit delta